MSPTKAAVGCIAPIFAALLLSSCGYWTSDSTRLERARSALQAGNPKAAIVDFGAIVDKNPGNLDAVAGLIQAYIAAGDSARAREELNKLPKTARESPLLLPRILSLLLLEGKYQEIVSTASKADRARSNEVVRTVGTALIRLGKFADAEALANQAISQSAADAELIGLLALAKFSRGEADQAIAVLASARQQVADPNLGVLEARFLVQSGRPIQAEQLLLALIDRYPVVQSPQLYYSLLVPLAEAQLAAGRYSTAEESFNKAESRLGRTAPILLGLSRAKAASGNPTAALGLLREAVKVGGHDAVTHCLEGALLLSTGESSTAIPALQECIAEQPQNVPMQKLLAAALMREHRQEEANDVVAYVRAASPFDADVFRLDHADRNAEGVAALADDVAKRLKSVAPTPKNLISAAELYVSLNQPARALEVLEAPINWSTDARARARLQAIARAGGNTTRDELNSELQEFVQQAGDDPATYALASRISLQQGSTSSARRYLEDGLRKFPVGIDLLHALAEMDIAEMRLDEASEVLKRLRSASAEPARVSVLQSKIANAKGDRQGAIDVLRQAARGATDQSIKVELVRNLIAAGDLRGATAAYQELEKARLPAALATDIQADLALLSGRPQEAVSILEQMAKLEPRDARVKYRLGLAHAAAGNPSSAITAMTRASELEPSNSMVAASLAYLLLSSARSDEALAVARKVRVARPGNSEPYLLEAAVLTKIGKYAEARATLAKGYSIKPSATIALRISELDVASKRAAPQDLLAEAWRIFPSDQRLPLAISQEHMRKGDVGRAIAVLESAARIEGPLSAVILNNLAWWYQQEGDKRALATAERAAALAPRNPSVLDTLGMVRIQTGDVPGGLKVLRGAVTIAPDFADLVEHLAEAEIRSGNAVLGRRALSEFGARHPDALKRPGFAKLLNDGK